jgi:GT2 family glycosyltransferase
MRREVFDRVGYFDEALGAGTPVGSWEDLEMIYRMLFSRCRLLHRPSAKVLHAHREDISGLSRQLCAYRRGEVCFCLLVVMRHHDFRAICHLMLWIPYWRATLLVRELSRRLQGKRVFRFDLMGREMLAYASGPAALASSSRHRAHQTPQEKK